MKSIKKAGKMVDREKAEGKRKSENSSEGRKIKKEEKVIAGREVHQDDAIAKKGDKADKTMGRYRSMRK